MKIFFYTLLFSIFCLLTFSGCNAPETNALDYDPNIYFRVNFNNRSYVTYGRPNDFPLNRGCIFTDLGSTLLITFSGVEETFSGIPVSVPDQCSVFIGGRKSNLTTLLGDYDVSSWLFTDITPNIPDLPISYLLSYDSGPNNNNLPNKISILSVNNNIVTGTINSYATDSSGRQIPISGEFRLKYHKNF